MILRKADNAAATLNVMCVLAGPFDGMPLA